MFWFKFTNLFVVDYFGFALLQNRNSHKFLCETGVTEKKQQTLNCFQNL